MHDLESPLLPAVIKFKIKNMNIQELQNRENVFCRITGKSKAGYPIETYGYVIAVNCESVLFRDGTDNHEFRIFDVKTCEPEELIVK